MVRSGTADPKTTETCKKQNMGDGITRVKLPFSPQKQWKAKGCASQTFRGYELESVKGIFLEEERVHFSDQ